MVIFLMENEKTFSYSFFLLNLGHFLSVNGGGSTVGSDRWNATEISVGWDSVLFWEYVFGCGS